MGEDDGVLGWISLAWGKAAVHRSQRSTMGFHSGSAVRASRLVQAAADVQPTAFWISPTGTGSDARSSQAKKSPDADHVVTFAAVPVSQVRR